MTRAFSGILTPREARMLMDLPPRSAREDPNNAKAPKPKRRKRGGKTTDERKRKQRGWGKLR